MQIKTLQKVYNVPPFSAIKAFNYILHHELADLDITIDSVNVDNHHLIVSFHGPDENFAYNYIVKHFGRIISASEFNEGDIVLGRLSDVGKVKFGFFVDIGLLIGNTTFEALYPLYEARSQLVNGLKVPLMSISRAFGLISNLPLEFKIIEKKILKRKIRVRLAPSSLNWLHSSTQQKLEAVIVCGATRRMIKRALIATKHFEDIETIERLGLLEYRLICKRGTRATGIIPEIGGLLGNALLGAQIPERVTDLRKRE